MCQSCSHGFVKVVLWIRQSFLHGFVKAVLWIRQSYYMDLVKVVLWNCQRYSMYFSPFANKTKLKFDQDLEAR